MSQEFLARILEQKAREVEQMELRSALAPGYRLAEILKNHQDRLQVIAEVKKASLVWRYQSQSWDIVQQAPDLYK